MNLAWPIVLLFTSPDACLICNNWEKLGAEDGLCVDVISDYDGYGRDGYIYKLMNRVSEEAFFVNIEKIVNLVCS